MSGWSATRRFGRTFADRTDLGGATAQPVGGIGVGTVKAVCRDNCNNGWMKRLEDVTKPILERLILKDEPVALARESQETLAAWAAKTATMLSVKYSKVPAESLLTPLRDHTRPADAAIVWLARVEPATVRVGSGPLLATWHDDPPIQAEGYIARLMFGNVGFVVFGNPGLRRPTVLVSQALRDRFRPIWPSQERPLLWPINVTVTANQLDDFSGGVRHAVTAGQPLPSAPDHHVYPFDEAELAPEAATRPQKSSE